MNVEICSFSNLFPFKSYFKFISMKKRAIFKFNSMKKNIS